MYGMNENQNVFMDGKRTTSRVTTEPGGKSTVKLGWDSPKAQEDKNLTSEAKKGELLLFNPSMKVAEGSSATLPSCTTKRKLSDRSTTTMMMTSTESSSSSHHQFSDSGGGGNSSSSRGISISSNAYANGASQNTGNVITDRPTSRVTQPPGGVSSISFY